MGASGSEKIRKRIDNMINVDGLDSLVLRLRERGLLSDYLFGYALLKRLSLSTHDNSWLERLKTPQGFSRATAKVYAVSRRTIQRRLRVVRAIRQREFDTETVLAYERGELSYVDLLAILKTKGGVEE